MKFSKYLQEMPPSSVMSLKVDYINCPIGHKFSPTDPEFTYDLASEMIHEYLWYLLADKTVGMINGKFDKPFPVACRKHGIVFMYDFEKEIGYEPRDKDFNDSGFTEIEMCESLIKGLKDKQKNPNTTAYQKFVIYKDEKNNLTTS